MNDLATAEVLMSERDGIVIDAPTAWAKGRMSAYLEMLPSALKPVIKLDTPWDK
jgi:hypothetical protein